MYKIEDFKSPCNAENLSRFQSLGDNCEFGLVQGRAGIEPIDLLRFAGLFIPIEHRLEKIIDAIRNRFAGLGDSGTFECALGGPPGGRREFYVQEHRYQLRYHTFKYEGEIEVDELMAQQSMVLKFWRRKFLDDLETGGEIYVWKSNINQSMNMIYSLHAALTEYSKNQLLWVTTFEQSGGQEETLVDMGDGLLIGTVRKFAPYDRAWEIDVQSWIKLCCLVT